MGRLVRAGVIPLLAGCAMTACSAEEDSAHHTAEHCVAANARPDASAYAETWIPDQVVTLGSEIHPEEAPRVNARIDGFWIDVFETTNADFERFVDASGYVTFAERDSAGGAVFENGQWRLDPTATWRNPFGSDGPRAQPRQPVVQVTYEDALAYARWSGRDLPTEVEWEAAARGGIAGAEYAWGSSSRLEDGRPGANHWQGVFPVLNTDEDGFPTLAPAGCFPPNPYGLYDMTGNVWELTKDSWGLRPGADAAAAAPLNESAPDGAHTIKGGSWLCADNFCRNYRPAARQPADPSMGTNHIGFRTVRRAPRATREGFGGQ